MMSREQMKNSLKIFFAGMSLVMACLAVTTSLKSDLWEVLPALNSQPLFVATIVDFYFNITIISVWVFYKEKSPIVAFLWIVAFVGLGSIATAMYVLIQLLKLRPGDPVENVLLRKV